MAAESASHAPDPAQHLFQLATGFVVSSALYEVANAGIADHLSSGPKTTAELARATKTNEDALYRILRALAAVGVFAETAPRTFGLTPAAELLQAKHPRSLRDIMVFLPDPFHMRVYADLGESLRTGRPAGEKTVGMPVFEYLAKDREYSEVFNRAMTTFSASMVPAALEAYDFKGIGVLVDVAGGQGELLMRVLQAHPQMRGILMDLPHVIEGAKPRLAASGLGGRIQAVPGDFFQAVPPGGDAYILKSIIHDWDDGRALKILRTIRQAMGGRRAKVILLEGVIEPGNTPDFGKIMDLEMLALPGGRERTADEFSALFAGAGFELTSVTRTTSPLCVIEAVVSH
jgi:hypothetical protein